jgi:hypothetical protein
MPRYGLTSQPLVELLRFPRTVKTELLFVPNARAHGSSDRLHQFFTEGD